MTNPATPENSGTSNSEASSIGVRKVSLDELIEELKRRGPTKKGPKKKLDPLMSEVDELIKQGFHYDAVYEFAINQGIKICKATAFKYFKRRQLVVDSEVRKSARKVSSK